MEQTGTFEIFKRLLNVLGITEDINPNIREFLNLLSNSIDLKSKFEQKYGWGTSDPTNPTSNYGGFNQHFFLSTLPLFFTTIYRTHTTDTRYITSWIKIEPSDLTNKLGSIQQDELLHIPLLFYKEGDSQRELSTRIIPLPTKDKVNNNDAGLAIIPNTAIATKDFKINDNWNLSLKVGGSIDGIGLIFRPDLVIFQGASDEASTPNFDLTAIIIR